MSDRADEIAAKLVEDHVWETGGTEGVAEAIADALRASEERAEKTEAEADLWQRSSSAWRGSHDEMHRRAQKAEARVKELEAALREAIDAIEGWAGYASDYFRDKHDLAGDLSRARAALGDKP